MSDKMLLDLSYYLVITVILAISILTLYKGYDDPVNISFAAALIFLVGWIYSAVMVIHYSFVEPGPLAHFWIKSAYFTFMPVPALFLFFSLSFSKIYKPKLLDVVLMALPVPVLWGLLVFDRIVTRVELLQGPYVREYFGAFIGPLLMYYFLFFGISFWVLLKKFFASRGQIRIQILYILLGCFIPLGFSLTVNVLVPLSGISYGWDMIHKISPFASVVLAVSVSAAIFKYRFMDLHYAVGKGFFFAILASFATAVYFFAIFVIATIFQGISGEYSFIAGLVFFFILAIIFDPFRSRLEKFTDKIFSRTKLDFEAAISEIADSMNLSADTAKFLNDCLKTIIKKTGLSGALFFIFDEKHDRFEVKAAEGCGKELLGYTLTGNYPLIEQMRKTGKPVLKRDFEKMIGDYGTPSCQKEEMLRVLVDMQNIGAAVCVPGKAKGRLIAVLALDPKLSGDDFDSAEISFFVTVTNQISIFVENAVLLEKERESARIEAESREKAKYVERLERINKELIKAREDLAKAERISTATRLSISLQHEINNPLTSVLAITQALLIKLSREEGYDPILVRQKMKTVEEEAKRIKQLLERLSGITDPIVREYMPGVEMIDLNAPER